MNYIKRKSKKQETRTAKEFGGKVTPASGALDGAKGDVRTNSFLIENKFTDKSWYRLDLKIWDKIFKEATKDGLRTPLMQIDIQELQLIVGVSYDIIEIVKDEMPEVINLHITANSMRIDSFIFDSCGALCLFFPDYRYPLVVIKKQFVIDGISDNML